MTAMTGVSDPRGDVRGQDSWLDEGDARFWVALRKHNFFQKRMTWKHRTYRYFAPKADLSVYSIPGRGIRFEVKKKQSQTLGIWCSRSEARWTLYGPRKEVSSPYNLRGAFIDRFGRTSNAIFPKWKLWRNPLTRTTMWAKAIKKKGE